MQHKGIVHGSQLEGGLYLEVNNVPECVYGIFGGI